MIRFFLLLCSLLMFPSMASAHGEEILMTIGAQLATVLVIIVALFMVEKFQRHLMGGVLTCFVGVILSWVLTGQMPYFENQMLITLIDVIFPLVTTGVFLAWRCRRVSQN